MEYVSKQTLKLLQNVFRSNECYLWTTDLIDLQAAAYSAVPKRFLILCW